MIRSMTGFGLATAESTAGTLSIEIRSVNSRYLDINLRLPEDLRMLETLIRESISASIKRGKIDIRANFSMAQSDVPPTIDETNLGYLADQYQRAKQTFPDLAPPRLTDVLVSRQEDVGMEAEQWQAMAKQALEQALAQLQAAREREGQRLAETMLDCANGIAGIIDTVEDKLPTILEDHQTRIATKLREALLAAQPEGFTNISGEELSARIAQESSLFSLRIDVAEELARLRSHVAELQHLLADDETATRGATKNRGSTGKRLDFLFQEMNREANTLGSKAGSLDVTNAAIDLKLLIEQMREQAQNIE